MRAPCSSSAAGAAAGGAAADLAAGAAILGSWRNINPSAELLAIEVTIILTIATIIAIPGTITTTPRLHDDYIHQSYKSGTSWMVQVCVCVCVCARVQVVATELFHMG